MTAVYQRTYHIGFSHKDYSISGSIKGMLLFWKATILTFVCIGMYMAPCAHIRISFDSMWAHVL